MTLPAAVSAASVDMKKKAAEGGSFTLGRPPRTDDELWWVVATLWGIEIPRLSVCLNHQSPFEAFADAYFARSPVSVWKASRGFGGKTTLMGALTATEGVTLGAESTILGGSAAQSLRVKEVMHECMDSPLAPKDMLAADPTRYATIFKNGGRVVALMASQRSVRGPHPQRLRLDEIDEMELAILEAAQGQPMSTPSVAAQTVMSSTHQYPDGTMTTILNRAVEKGWPVFEWCWRETQEPHGWLLTEELERKRLEVSNAMWLIEYDLQEPSFEGRAIDGDSVDRAFDPDLGVWEGKENEYIEISGPIEGHKYMTSADWAKKKDWTIIRTFDVTDPEQWIEVAFLRMGRRPWPDMVKAYDERMDRYGGKGVYDSTGLGDVVGDLLESEAQGILMVGRTRQDMFSDYISAIENNRIRSPRIDFMYNEHKYVTLEDLYKPSGHPPDTFVAGALAWHKRHRLANMLPPVSLTKQKSNWIDRG